MPIVKRQIRWHHPPVVNGGSEREGSERHAWGRRGVGADARVGGTERRPPVGGAAALQTAGTSGAGVTVAVIDLGFQDLNTTFGATLPSWLSTQNFNCGGYTTPGASNGLNAWGPTQHGTAVTEIVHQMAPGAHV